MSANIDTSNGRDNVAFLGSRKDVWHHLGQEMVPGMSIEAWAKAAGLDWTAVLVPAYADLRGTCGHDKELSYLSALKEVPNRFFNVRSDTGHVLGYASDRYQNVQPKDVLSWFERYISVDDRFALDVAGSLGQGETIWATATYNGDITVAGEKHTARLLMSTTFDGSAATINQGTITRVVCNNTLNAAHYDKRAVIRTRHNTAFQPATVAKELARIAQGFEVYKLMGDALAQAEMTREATAEFFKAMAGIPKDAKDEEISTRKENQYRDLAQLASVVQGAHLAHHAQYLAVVVDGAERRRA